MTLAHESKPASPPPPLTPAIMGPITKEAAKLWPGVPSEMTPPYVTEPAIGLRVSAVTAA